MAIWNDIEALGKVARMLPYVLIFLGFVVAASGQYFRSIVDARITVLEASASIAYKSTTPLMNAFLAHSEKSRKKLLVVDTENDIPFKASWFVVTENDELVSPLMIEKKEFVPAQERQRFSAEITIDADKVINSLIELRFRYESIYSSELNDPAHLHGEIRERYKYINGQLLPWR